MKSKRIGAMTKNRGDWSGMNPVTKVIESKKKRNDRKKAKNDLKKYKR